MDARPSPKLLVVEDRAVMLKIIRRLLLQLGYTDIDGAINGVAALEMVRATDYDLVLSDWNMDGMSGFELLKHMRAEPRTAQVPFILVTAEAKADNMRAAEAAGANGYLLKPFKLDALEAVVNEALGKTAVLAPV